MTKYLRCFKSGQYITAGKRYEIIEEADGLFVFLDDDGDEHCWSIEPDEDGDSYRNHFTLETDEDDASVTVLPDESLNGIEREYREVKRKADKGGRIKIVKLEAAFGDYELGDVMSVHARDAGGVRTVETAGGWGGDGHIYVFDEEYVVLEPTDIVHIAGERLRMVDRKATVGDRVIIVSSDKTKSVGCAFRHKVGEAGDVDSRLPDRLLVNGWYILDGDYHVLEPLTAAPLLSEQSAQDQAAATISALALRLDALEETVRRMGTDIRVAQEDIDIMDESIAYDVRKLETEVAALKVAVTTHMKTQPATPVEVIASLKRHRTTQQNIKAARQQRRDDIVERAKADVADLRKYKGTPIPNDDVSFWPLTEQPMSYVPLHTVEFVVNLNKRTVVAIIRCTCDGHVTRGIAKCAPDDVFNAHIGKAISLRRALGLGVPAEYLSVPKPTEVRVGDVVEGTSHSGATGPVLEIGHDGEENFVIYRNDTNRRYFNKCWSGVTRVIILDDTREEVAA